MSNTPVTKSKSGSRIFWPLTLMVLIFIESSIPMDGGPNDIAFLTNLDPNMQNLLHIPLYGMLAFLWQRYFSTLGKGIKQAVFFTLVVTICYGGLDEFHQSFVPGRYGGLLDIYLDMAGAVLGVIVFMRLCKGFKKDIE